MDETKNKEKLKELIEIQSRSIQDDYNAGLFNGLVTAYNTQYKERLPLCSFNETLKTWGCKHEQQKQK